MQYSTKSVKELTKIAQKHFNKFIRERDKGKPCINCGDNRKLQAGHYFPTGTYPGLRFDEDNCNGECLQCNYFNSQSHSYGYRNNLIKKIGQERFNQLELKAGMSKRSFHKWDRFTLIEIIEKYKDAIRTIDR